MHRVQTDRVPARPAPARPPLRLVQAPACLVLAPARRARAPALPAPARAPQVLAHARQARALARPVPAQWAAARQPVLCPVAAPAVGRRRITGRRWCSRPPATSARPNTRPAAAPSPTAASIAAPADHRLILQEGPLPIGGGLLAHQPVGRARMIRADPTLRSVSMVKAGRRTSSFCATSSATQLAGPTQPSRAIRSSATPPAPLP